MMSRKIGQIFRRFFAQSSPTFTQPYTVVVEGNIGSGKTTFLQPFTKHKGLVEVLPEPVDKWRNLQGHNLLQKMYENPQKYSLLLQTYIQLTMAQLHCQPCPTPVRIMERSLLRYCFTENLMNSGKLEESEYLVLSEWFNFLITCPHLDFHVDQIIYLRTDPEIAYQRILKRDRVEEHQIPLQYIKDLHELHEDWLIRKNKFSPVAPVTVIDANCDLTDLTEKYFECEKDIVNRALKYN